MKKIIHLIYWVFVTTLFLIERDYLIQKAGLPHFIECTAVRVGLLVLLTYINTAWLMPVFLFSKKYGSYVLAVLGLIAGYLALQSLYDYYLFGFVLGVRSRELYLTFVFNSLNSVWYVLLSIGLKLALDWYGHRNDLPKELLPAAAGSDYIFVKSGVKKIRINFDEVTHIQGLKDYAIVYAGTEKIIVKGSVKLVHELFPAPRFIRVHKSFLVAKEKIRKIDRNLIVIGEHRIPVGRSYKHSLQIPA